MATRNDTAFRLALLFLIVLPVCVHTIFKGSYKPYDARTFWIGPISTTVPYVFLTLLFGAHCFDLKSRSRRAPYFGAISAWVCMMALTVFIVMQPRGPDVTSTMGIAMGLTPVVYIPFLALPYIVGASIGSLLTRREERNAEREDRRQPPDL